MARVLTLLPIVLVVATSLAGCASGSIRNESDAVAAAKRISGLAEPITVVDVRSGPAGDIFNGPPPSLTNDMIAKERVRRARPAWAVDLQGFVREPCADTQYLPCGLVTIELVIDRDTAEVLYSMVHG